MTIKNDINSLTIEDNQLVISFKSLPYCEIYFNIVDEDVQEDSQDLPIDYTVKYTNNTEYEKDVIEDKIEQTVRYILLEAIENQTQ